jgi:hypothetical protein
VSFRKQGYGSKLVVDHAAEFDARSQRALDREHFPTLLNALPDRRS